MLVNGTPYRTIWLKEGDEGCVQIIDQRPLPHQFVIEEIRTVDSMASAIREMHLRGAGLIGAAAGYGMYLAALEGARLDLPELLDALEQAGDRLRTTRPTAVNLEWAVRRQLRAVASATSATDAISILRDAARAIADEDSAACERIGLYGVELIREISRKRGRGTVNVLTHCNAGWLAFVDHGTATAPIYRAHEEGLDVHVWVDETRPRNQGARLTAWELGQQGVPHTVIADNVGGHLMQHGLVDIVITGADRVTATGDVANKIGTYLKALAASDNDIPFFAALPSSTIDWATRDGVAQIPIEQRDGSEVKFMSGLHDGEIVSVLLTPEGSPAANYAFDVTPARLVSGLITERGVAEASEAGLLRLFPGAKIAR